MIRLFSLAFLIASINAAAQPAQHATLASMRDQARLLLIFSPSNTPMVDQQKQEILSHFQDAQSRQLVIVPIIGLNTKHAGPVSPSGELQIDDHEAASARHRFHIAPQAFTVILLGKDGGEKFRSSELISFAQLRELIDSMPMRQQEMRHPK